MKLRVRGEGENFRIVRNAAREFFIERRRIREGVLGVPQKFLGESVKDGREERVVQTEDLSF